MHKIDDAAAMCPFEEEVQRTIWFHRMLRTKRNVTSITYLLSHLICSWKLVDTDIKPFVYSDIAIPVEFEVPFDEWNILSSVSVHTKVWIKIN